MIDFGMLRKEITNPLGSSEVRKLQSSTRETNTYCSLQSEVYGYVCLCSCILEGIKYYILEKN